MVATWQPWWVQVALNALKVPAVGWVTTTFWSLKILPPPAGTAEAGPRSAPAPAPAPELLLGGADVASEPVGGALEAPLSELPHAASAGAPIPSPVTARAVRRLNGSLMPPITTQARVGFNPPCDELAPAAWPRDPPAAGRGTGPC